MIPNPADKIRNTNRNLQRLLLLFLAADVVFIQVRGEHRVRNYVVLFVIGWAIALSRTFWLRRMLRRQGIDLDADDVADAREEVRAIARTRALKRKSKS